MEHWHRLPRGCGVSSLELSRSCLAVGLCTLLWVVLLELELGLGHRDTEGPARLSSNPAAQTAHPPRTARGRKRSG